MTNHDPQRYFSIRLEDQFLRGTAYLAQPDAMKRCPAVILIHGFAGQRTEHAFMFVSIARALNTAGIHAITFDFRGSGEADGAFEEILPSRQLEDIAAVMRWAGGQPYVDRNKLGLLGFSIGGLFACCSLIHQPAPKALALLAPTTIDNFKRFDVPREDGTVTFGPHHLHSAFFTDLDGLDPESAIKSHCPASLILQGDADTRVPPGVSDWFRQRLSEHGPDPIYHLLTGADHGFNKKRYRKTLDSQCAAFFSQVFI